MDRRPRGRVGRRAGPARRFSRCKPTRFGANDCMSARRVYGPIPTWRCRYKLRSRESAQCQNQCRIRVSEGSGGEGNSKGVSKLLILIILPAGSSPSLSWYSWPRQSLLEYPGPYQEGAVTPGFDLGPNTGPNRPAWCHSTTSPIRDQRTWPSPYENHAWRTRRTTSWSGTGPNRRYPIHLPSLASVAFNSALVA